MSRGRIGRDAELLRLFWSFGVLLPAQAQQLCGCSRPALWRRLGPLVACGALRRLPYRGSTTLYAIGPEVAAVDPALAGGWVPPPAVFAHTLLTADLVIAFVRRGRPPISSWAGEAEVRAWVGRGEAIPDATLSWRDGARAGQLLVETDRATEPERVWQAKLLRYRGLWADEAVLAAAPGRARARRIATLAHDRGVRLLAGVHRDLVEDADPMVFDAAAHRRIPLSAALPGPAG